MVEWAKSYYPGGLKTIGTLWSASAILQDNYHELVEDIHLDYINAGCDVIITTTFSTRKQKVSRK